MYKELPSDVYNNYWNIHLNMTILFTILIMIVSFGLSFLFFWFFIPDFIFLDILFWFTIGFITSYLYSLELSEKYIYWRWAR